MKKVVLLFLFLNCSAFCCQCAYVSVKEQYNSADIIFLGRTIGEPVLSYSGYITKLEVLELFKGPKADTIYIESGMGGGDCGFIFSENEAYLVYAHGNNNLYYTSICTRTRHISEANADLQFIKAFPGSLNITAFAGNINLDSDNTIKYGRYRGINNYKFRIGNELHSYELETDSAGYFYINGVVPGKYTLILNENDKLGIEQDYYSSLSGNPDITIEILENEVNEEEFTLAPTNIIRGVVIDEHGDPIEAPVQLIPEIYFINKDDPFFYSCFIYLTISTTGKFEFVNIPDGKYYLGISLTEKPDTYSPFPQTFYTAAEDTVKTVLEVRNGSVISGIKFNVFNKYNTFEINIRLSTADSIRWKNANVELNKTLKKSYQDKIADATIYGGQTKIKVLENTAGYLFIYPENTKEYMEMGLMPEAPEPILIEPNRNYDLDIKINLVDMGYKSSFKQKEKITEGSYYYMHTDMIFLGKVIEADSQYCIAKMIKSYKGQMPDTIKMMSGITDFHNGEEYLIYADNLGNSALTSKVIPIEAAGEEIEYLKMQPAAGDGDYTFFTGAAYIQRQTGRESMHYFSFTLNGSEQNYRIYTDESGMFFTDTIPPGEYKVMLDDPFLCISEPEKYGKVTLANKNTARYEFTFTVINSLKGTVLNPDGSPAESVVVELIPSELINKILDSRLFSTQTNPGGKFEFLNTPPGKYYLGINIISEPNAWNPWSRTLYKNSEDINSAELIEIKKGDIIENILLRPKSKSETKTIRGKLVDLNGNPVDNYIIYLSDSSLPGGKKLATAIKGEEKGSFLLKVSEPSEGWLVVSSGIYPYDLDGRKQYAEAVKIEPGKNYANLTIKVGVAWFIKKLSDEDFILPDENNFENYDSLKQLFRQWCFFPLGSEDVILGPAANPGSPCQGYTFYPDGKVEMTYDAGSFISFELRWRMNVKNDKLIAFVAPNDDIMHTAEIIQLNNEKLDMKFNGSIAWVREGDVYRARCYQAFDGQNIQSSEFTIPSKQK